MEGLDLVIRCGYDPQESINLFRHIKEELEEEVEEPFFFGTHPRLEDRIENCQAFLASDKREKGGLVNKEVFQKKTSGAVLINASLDLRQGRFRSALRGAEKYLSAEPKSSEGYCLLGKIYRQRNETRDTQKAEESLKKAITLDKSNAEPFRELGLVYYKGGEKRKAAKAFESYLKLSPKATDREYVKQYISQCK